MMFVFETFWRLEVSKYPDCKIGHVAEFVYSLLAGGVILSSVSQQFPSGTGVMPVLTHCGRLLPVASYPDLQTQMSLSSSGSSQSTEGEVTLFLFSPCLLPCRTVFLLHTHTHSWGVHNIDTTMIWTWNTLYELFDDLIEVVDFGIFTGI